MFMVVNNIKFEKQKTKVDKVIVVEKLVEGLDENENSPEKLKIEAQRGIGNNCAKLDSKEGCTALGGCVWVTGTDIDNMSKKCVEAAGTSGNMARGSNGPANKCFQNKNGKYVPWEKYYYLDGANIRDGSGVSKCA